MSRSNGAFPHHDIEAERAFVGGVLTGWNDAVPVAKSLVEPSDFAGVGHACVYEVALRQHAAGDTPSLETVRAELQRDGLIETIGGPGTLEEIAANGVAPSSLPRLGQIIREHAVARRTVAIGSEIVEAGNARDYSRVAALARQLDGETPLLTRAKSKASMSGATFILDTPAETERVWGAGTNIAWAAGEPFMIVGPTGAGKTTIAGQLVCGRLGLCKEVLGMSVVMSNVVLYIAADRPKQAARSFRRMTTELDREILEDQLVVWRGPLPYDLAKEPGALTDHAKSVNADTVVIDSLKDVAVKLTDDEVGARVNQALQLATVNGIEVAVLHHQRKGQQGAPRPKHIDDVYGSTWLTAGMGSVILVWGNPGDSIVTLEHLKQPVDDIGPLTLMHDHDTGHTTVHSGGSLIDLVRNAAGGITAEAAAVVMFGHEEPERNEVEKSRRRLNKLEGDGLVHRFEAHKGADGRQQPTVYVAVDGRR